MMVLGFDFFGTFGAIMTARPQIIGDVFRSAMAHSSMRHEHSMSKNTPYHRGGL